jgi:hypothetical protein
MALISISEKLKRRRGQPLKMEIGKKVEGGLYYDFLISRADP